MATLEEVLVVVVVEKLIAEKNKNSKDEVNLNLKTDFDEWSKEIRDPKNT